MGPTDRVCFSSEEAARLARPVVVFDKMAKRIALLAGTLALIRRQEVCSNHWDYYGSASTATAVMQVYYWRAGEIPAAMEAPVRYRRDLMTIIKGDAQVAKTREERQDSCAGRTSSGRFGASPWPSRHLDEGKKTYDEARSRLCRPKFITQRAPAWQGNAG